MTEVCLLGKAYILHYYINHFSGDEFLRITTELSRVLVSQSESRGSGGEYGDSQEFVTTKMINVIM
jgi:hypothetical protein